MIGYVYHNGKSNTANQDLGVKVAHSIGTFVGQLLFGWLGDVVGRKKMYGIELVSHWRGRSGSIETDISTDDHHRWNAWHCHCRG